MAVKVRAVRCWIGGCSLRHTVRFFRYLCSFSHEAVRLWARALRSLVGASVPARERRLIVVDETEILLVNGRKTYEWVALDRDRFEVVFRWRTAGRGGLDALIFLKNVLRRCLNRPAFMVDRGVWYPWALDLLRLEWEVGGGPRSLVESYNGSLKWVLRRMRRNPQGWHTHESLEPILAWQALVWNEDHPVTA